MTAAPRLPQDAVVLVIDLQTGMFDGVMEPPLHDSEALADRTRALIDWARRTGRKIAFVRHDGPPGDPLAPGQPGWPVWFPLGQSADEPTFSKSARDAFSNPELGRWIEASGARDVVLAGAQSEFCITGTVAGALAAGLAVTVVRDAHSTRDDGDVSAPAIIDRCNVAFEASGARLVTVADLASAP